MTSLLLSKRLTSIKIEVAIVLCILLVVILLPVIAVMSVTNVSALFGDSGTDHSVVSLYTIPADPKDLYDYGYCTYWAALRRIQVGNPIPNNWGNAITWATRAVLDDYTVDHTPTKYSIMQTPNAPGGLGHVAFVESVDSDGTWHISEMNAVGWDETDIRTMSASSATKYNFIHDRTPNAL